jgi:hypothetical protein
VSSAKSTLSEENGVVLSSSDEDAIHRGLENSTGLADLAEYLYVFNCHGMICWPDKFGRRAGNPRYSGSGRHSDPDRERGKGQMSDLEICLKLRRERDDGEQ